MQNCFLHLLTRNYLFGVGHSTTCIGTYLVTDGSLNVYKYCTRYVFAVPVSAKKRRKQVVGTTDGQVTRHRTIKLDTVFETVEIPAGIYRSDTSLAEIC